MRILVAEDERITRRTLQRQLESWGHEVVVAEDGAEAWDRFQQQQCDIVVTDWDMPRLDGRALVERIRGSGASGYVYLIMLTGRSEKADLIAGMEAGADDFLAKPFDQNELRVRVNAGERIIRLERNLAAHNTRMKRSLDAAADIQRDLLPKNLPETLAAKFAWHYEPCDELGGDILNILPLDVRDRRQDRRTLHEGCDGGSQQSWPRSPSHRRSVGRAQHVDRDARAPQGDRRGDRYPSDR